MATVEEATLDLNEALCDVVANVFCATGEGGGIDPSCPSGQGGRFGSVGSKMPSTAHVRQLQSKLGSPTTGGQVGNDPDIEQILEHGEFQSSEGLKYLKMKDGECHWNASKLFRQGKIDSIVIGYCQTIATDWHQHTWGMKDGKIVETTAGNMLNPRYYGWTLSKEMSKEFADHALDENSRPGMGAVRHSIVPREEKVETSPKEAKVPKEKNTTTPSESSSSELKLRPPIQVGKHRYSTAAGSHPVEYVGKKGTSWFRVIVDRREIGEANGLENAGEMVKRHLRMATHNIRSSEGIPPRSVVESTPGLSYNLLPDDLQEVANGVTNVNVGEDHA